MSAAFVATAGGSGAMVGERHPLPSEPSELGALEGCSAIDVTGNASLSDAVVVPLLELASLTTRIGGNAGSTVPLDPCPWADDPICDADDGLCAPGSDADDCSLD